ncbi:MAG: hypothetical protein ACI9US_003857, partial [Gammaproteobacteria bacterium]
KKAVAALQNSDQSYFTDPWGIINAVDGAQ